MARSWDEILHDNRIDDEGNYDYYAEDLPEDSVKWERGMCRCESCGKYRRLTLCSRHYFYCWDGWDYMGYNECWRCHLKSQIRSIRYRFKHKKAKIRETINKLTMKAKFHLFIFNCKRKNKNTHKEVQS